MQEYERQPVTLADLQDMPVLSMDDGEAIGTIEEIFYNEPNGDLEWIGVSGDGPNAHVVPAEGAALEDDGLYVPYTGEMVRGSPDFAREEGMPPETQRELRAYYGMQDGEPDAALGYVRMSEVVFESDVPGDGAGA